ncbi:MAG TPA: CBS domain-containing protein [Nitrospira sp.]|nr:CBS domain-containing protein [Nitrospira sp.]
MRTREIKIQDVMTMNPDWCLSESSATQAARIMKDTNVGIVPIVDSDSGRKLIGVVTDRDLCLAVVATGKNPDSVRVAEAMTSQLVTCQPDDDIRKATHLMQGNQVRRVPVVDRNGVLQGMVSTADILQRANLSASLTHETMKEVTKPTDEESRSRTRMKHAA